MPILFDRGPRLSHELFRLIRDLVNDFCGIDFGDETVVVVERRLRERLHTLGLADFEQYYQYLRYHPEAGAEMERAVEELTTNETYLFREEYQLQGFATEVLPELRARNLEQGSRRLAIWSAGCSTGEEAYTLAMVVHETRLFEGWDVRIFGNDISRRVLKTARQAIYGPSSFRAMPRRYHQYFIETPNGLQVHPTIRSMCHFGHLNLLDRSRAAMVGRVDAIFCRNVLIYFDGNSRKQVIDIFYDRLAPGGYLMLGHSESLLHVTTAFELAHLSSDLVYRKPLRSGTRRLP